MRTATTTAALLAFWCVVVPPDGWPDVLVGLVAAWALALWSARFLWPDVGRRALPLHPWRALAFGVLLVRRILVSATQVLRIVLDPRLPIAPEVLRETVRFDEEAARVAFANAITVTPGTLTLEVDGDTFVVHALDRALAQDVLDGSLARDVARLFEPRRAS